MSNVKYVNEVHPPSPLPWGLFAGLFLVTAGALVLGLALPREPVLQPAQVKPPAVQVGRTVKSIDRDKYRVVITFTDGTWMNISAWGRNLKVSTSEYP